MTSNAVLITGGAKRIGKEIAFRLAILGYDIALHYNRSHEDALLVKDNILKKKVKCEIFKYDLSIEKNLEEMMGNVVNIFPNLNIIINSASIFKRARLVETGYDLFNRTVNINFKAPYFISKIFAKKIGHGQIINIVDTKIAKNNFLYSIYNLSKKALTEFTYQAANELGPKIRVNAVAPGLILPPDNKDDYYLEKIAQGIPLKRKGELSDVIKAVEYLIDNEYLTGQIIFVDGGQHL